jgi:hypothetical protein
MPIKRETRGATAPRALKSIAPQRRPPPERQGTPGRGLYGGGIGPLGFLVRRDLSRESAARPGLFLGAI